MIYVLSDGQFGMPGDDEKPFFSTSSSSPDGASKGGSSGFDAWRGGQGEGLPLVRLEGGGLGIAREVATGEAGSDREAKLRAQRARLSAGVACLWAGIGVGAMLCGQTAEDTMRYAENAREAIKGCYDVVSEEVGGGGGSGIGDVGGGVGVIGEVVFVDYVVACCLLLLVVACCCLLLLLLLCGSLTLTQLAIVSQAPC